MILPAQGILRCEWFFKATSIAVSHIGPNSKMSYTCGSLKWICWVSQSFCRKFFPDADSHDSSKLYPCQGIVDDKTTSWPYLWITLMDTSWVSQTSCITHESSLKSSCSWFFKAIYIPGCHTVPDNKLTNLSDSLKWTWAESHWGPAW